jgi:mannitol/fructose-specific phosphotransferase system IIA component (Ntr-type)
MSLISRSLLEKDVHLTLKGSDPGDALEELFRSLVSDPRVRDWKKLRESLVRNSATEAFREVPSAMFLHHSRTPTVSELVLAVGRSDLGISIPGRGEPCRLLFIAAIPEALDNDYLRVLGAISRICRNMESLVGLLQAGTPAAFVDRLEEGCRS